MIILNNTKLVFVSYIINECIYYTHLFGTIVWFVLQQTFSLIYITYYEYNISNMFIQLNVSYLSNTHFCLNNWFDYIRVSFDRIIFIFVACYVHIYVNSLLKYLLISIYLCFFLFVQFSKTCNSKWILIIHRQLFNIENQSTNPNRIPSSITAADWIANFFVLSFILSLVDDVF